MTVDALLLVDIDALVLVPVWDLANLAVAVPRNRQGYSDWRRKRAPADVSLLSSRRHRHSPPDNVTSNNVIVITFIGYLVFYHNEFFENR